MSNHDNTQMVIYQAADGAPQISVRLEDKTLWLTQAQIVELFESSKANISEHIKHIFGEGEQDANSVVRNFRTTAADGKTYNIKYYNLDMILSVGYRVKSARGTQFRQWATPILHEYLQKGFSINTPKLKEAGGGNYWKELLDEIRDIRSSEKALYRQVLDLYATSMDYNPKADESVKFFQTVQNKLHYTVSGNTAAEIVWNRANAEFPFMGLTNFPTAKIRKADVTVAKNYMRDDELFRLNRLVSAFFDLAEIRASEHTPMYMRDWLVELDRFTDMYGNGTLTDNGSVSHANAVEKAESEYAKFKVRELSAVETDYLNMLKQMEQKLKHKVKDRDA